MKDFWIPLIETNGWKDACQFNKASKSASTGQLINHVQRAQKTYLGT